MMSSLMGWVLAVLIGMVGPAFGHEVRPAIADVSFPSGQVRISMTLSLEALVGGLDLSEIDDTNASPLAGRYDQLRALEPAQLERQFLDVWPVLLEEFHLASSGLAMPMSISDLEIPPVGDGEMSRETTLVLSTAIAPDQLPVTFGWDARLGPLVVRQEISSDTAESAGYSAYLTQGEQSAPLSPAGTAQQSWLSQFNNYIGIGFEHIIPKGLDHILFVLGLFFFSLKLRPLISQITAFTVAHTVALALAMLGIIAVPAAIVEPLIAASIVYVAVENVFSVRLHAWRTAVVFAFGLLHGLGFASVLSDIGLDPTRFLTGLIGFNIGVELGQLCVIGLAFLAVGYWFGGKPWYRRVISTPASVSIAIIGAYWFAERVLA